MNPILYRANKETIERCCRERKDEMIDYESFCREFSSRGSTSSSSTSLSVPTRKYHPHNNQSDNMWRRLRRWSQDLISEGVQIESSLKEWNGSNIMPRHEFRECLTYLGAPIRGESEWYVVWSLRIFFSDVIITSHFQHALSLSEVLEHH